MAVGGFKEALDVRVVCGEAVAEVGGFGCGQQAVGGYSIIKISGQSFAW